MKINFEIELNEDDNAIKVQVFVIVQNLVVNCDLENLTASLEPSNERVPCRVCQLTCESQSEKT